MVVHIIAECLEIEFTLPYYLYNIKNKQHMSKSYIIKLFLWLRL